MENIEKVQQTSSETLQATAGPDVVLPDVKADLRYPDGARGDMQSLPTDVIPSDSETKMERLLHETVSTQQIQATVESSEEVQAGTRDVGESQASATNAERGTGSPMEEDEPMTLVEEIFDLLEGLGEKVASRPVGQTLFRQSDHVLNILEKCVAWSESSPDSDQAGQRPLPWYTFLPVLATLKVAVFGANVVAPLFGRKSKSKEDIVDYIRSQRRKIHAIRNKGISNMGEENYSAQDYSVENTRLIDKLLLWWPITVVTKLADIVGLGSEDSESSKTLVKRSYEQMVKEDMLLDTISPPRHLEETSSSEEDEVEEEEEQKADTMFADDIIKRITEINFEEEDSEEDPDYEPPEESDGTSETSSEEDFTDEENPSAGTEMATNTEIEQEERKLKVPRLDIEDADSKTITTDDSKTKEKTEDKPEDNAEKEIFVSATSSGYQSPEHPSSRRESRASSPTAELRADTPRPVNEPAVEKKPSKLSSLFSRKKT
ncbi:neurofilament medium polypeptide isoform X1 [Anabrus simplex]|uniref:neurofilament medium polypeptide isoform X1 n=1 Tax=Anabrus simplex TaxID=316456 RepID=UPI0035A34D75